MIEIHPPKQSEDFFFTRKLISSKNQDVCMYYPHEYLVINMARVHTYKTSFFRNKIGIKYFPTILG